MPYGQDSKIAIAFQTSHGTPVTAITSFYPMPFLSESVVPSVPELLAENMQGRFDEGEAYAGARNVGGTISNEALPVAIGVMLKAICGTPTIVTSASLKTHTFVPATADFDSNAINIPMTYHKNLADGGQVPVYQDLVATKFELSISNGELLKASIDITGGAVASKTTSQDVGTADGKNWTWDVTSLQLGGAANTEFSNVTITQDEQASPRWTLQTQRDPSRVKRDNRRQIRINGTVRFVDQTEYDLFLARTTQIFKVTLRASDSTAIQSGYYNTMTVEAPSFRYIAYPMPLTDASELNVSFEGKADYNVGSGHSIKYTLINTQANF